MVHLFQDSNLVPHENGCQRLLFPFFCQLPLHLLRFYLIYRLTALFQQKFLLYLFAIEHLYSIFLVSSACGVDGEEDFGKGAFSEALLQLVLVDLLVAIE